MTDKNTELEQQEFDPLDMNNYKVEKLPKMQKSGFEKWMARLGMPLAIISFVLFLCVLKVPFIDDLKDRDLDKKSEYLSDKGQKGFDGLVTTHKEQLTKEYKVEQGYDAAAAAKIKDELPEKVQDVISAKADSVVKADSLAKEILAEADSRAKDDFIANNYAMLAIFIASVILWITEAVPSYLTSLLVIVALVLCGVVPQKEAFAQLGHPVMWLNILSFVLASMLVKTRVAKRFALWFVLKFGKSASGIFFSFLIINVVLSMFISATTVKATILLPIFMVIAAIFGASQGKRNNFGRNLVLQNLFQVNIGASAFMTGSGANLLAISLMVGATGAYTDMSFGYSDWLAAGFPLAMILLLLGWFVGVKLIFPMKKEEKEPQLAGGMARLREELDSMGKMTRDEFKTITIFVSVLVLWVTKNWHGIDETTVAFMGAIVALLPGVGVVKWNDVDIPWHLMIFSAGAYALGSGLNATDLPNIAVSAGMDSLGITADTPFIVPYLLMTGLMLFSALLFQSKNMRALVFIPIALGVEAKFGYPALSLAFPMALLIEHVYVLPFNSKPAALLYTTNHYSWSDTFKFGITMMMIAWAMIIIWGATVLHWLGYTPNYTDVGTPAKVESYEEAKEQPSEGVVEYEEAEENAEADNLPENKEA